MFTWQDSPFFFGSSYMDFYRNNVIMETYHAKLSKKRGGSMLSEAAQKE